MNVLSFLQEHRIPYADQHHRHGRYGWIQIDCPFCGTGSRQFHFGIHLEELRGNCWRCGPHKLAWALSKVSPLSYSEINRRIRSGYVPKKRKSDHFGKYLAPPGVTPMQPAHRKYIKARRFDPDEIEALWGVQGIGIAAKLQWRLFLPVIYQEETVSWTARSIAHKPTLRYISAAPEHETIPQGQLLYGLDYVRHAAIICEGPTDVWRIGPGAVATFGTAFNAAQVKLLSKIPIRVICFDKKATKEAGILADRLSIFPGETLIVDIDSDDPGDATEKEVKEIRKYLV